MQAMDFLDRVSRELQDETRVRWTLEELARYTDAGQIYICSKAPHILSEWRTLTLAEGIRQAVPADCLGVLEIARNVAGTKRAITQVARDDMNAMAPNWGNERASNVIYHYIQDAREPMFFEVYPPAKAGVQVHALVSRKPQSVGASAQNAVALPDEWIEALRHYVLYRAWSMDAEFASNAQLAALHLQACHDSLGVVPARPRTGEDSSR